MQQKAITRGRRGRFDIMLDILQRCLKGAKKTQVVYGCNLNFKLLRGYKKELVDKGLLEERNGELFTTLKGKRCLEWFRTGRLEFGLL